MAVEPKIPVGTEHLDDLAMQIGFVVPRDDLHAAVTLACENPGEGFLAGLLSSSMRSA